MTSLTPVIMQKSLNLMSPIQYCHRSKFPLFSSSDRENIGIGGITSITPMFTAIGWKTEKESCYFPMRLNYISSNLGIKTKT